MTKKASKLHPDLQKDLLDKPLHCLEGVDLIGLTMNDGIHLIEQIVGEINNYLHGSSLAKNLARQKTNRQKKLANLSIVFDKQLEVVIFEDPSQEENTQKKTPKPKKQNKPKKITPTPTPIPTTLIVTEGFEIEETPDLDSLIAEATKRDIPLKGIPKTVDAIRDHIKKVVLERDAELPIIKPSKPRPTRVVSMTSNKEKKQSRLSKLVDLAKTRDLEELEQYASKTLGVEDTDDSQDRF